MHQVQKLSKAFAGQVLFENVTWSVSAGERVGLTGPNGSGKTTLLRMLAGTEAPDAGEITAPRGTRVGFLPQDGLFHQGRTLREEATSVFADVLALGDELRDLEETMSRMEPTSPNYQDVLKRYGECQEEWDRQEGFSIEARVEEVLRGLGFTGEELEARTETFSGGWQMRIALAKLLLIRPDTLLLDEPTNHLDLEARNWLEVFLAGYPHAVVLVSHDRYFLDQVVTRITEIDRRQLRDFPGNYSRYLEIREKQIAELRASARRQQEEIERIQRFIDRFRYQATKAAQVQSRVKMLEKIERIEVPPERKILKLRLPQPVRSGRVVLELRGVGKRYGKKEVFRGVDFLIERGDRLALVGPNGTGKSTMMRLLAGAEPPDAGTVAPGHNVSRGYFSQDRAFDLDGEKTVLANLVEAAPIHLVPQLRNILGAFLFRADDVEKKVKVLSGGEKSRLALAKMLLHPANVLILDEPTNHLDLDSKEVLLEALKDFRGTLIFVSHDRYFIDELATKTGEVGGGTLKLHWGNYEDFVRLQSASPSTTEAAPAQELPARTERGRETAPSRSARPNGRSNRDREHRKKIQRLEESISETEIAVASLEGRMAVPGFYDDPAASAEVVATHQSLKGELDRLYQEWETLERKPAKSRSA
ncbi:MAG: ABC-F family ATP-binding cassette domain-containing protein [Vicinamibacteria bacterium]